MVEFCPICDYEGTKATNDTLRFDYYWCPGCRYVFKGTLTARDPE